MSAASNYLENALLNHTLRNAAYTQPGGLWLALFKSTVDGATTLANLEGGTTSTDEVGTSGTAYARKAIEFGSTSTGTSANSNTVTFDAATASWGTITHIAVMDGSTRGSGNVLFYGAVTTSKTIDTGDTFQVSIGNLTIALA